MEVVEVDAPVAGRSATATSRKTVWRVAYIGLARKSGAWRRCLCTSCDGSVHGRAMEASQALRKAGSWKERGEQGLVRRLPSGREQ